MKRKSLLFLFVIGLALLMSLTSYSEGGASQTINKVLNPSFELDPSGVKNQKITNWVTVSEKDEDGDFTESGWTHSGENKLSHWKATDFKVGTYQNIENLENGVYNFEFWYANGDGGTNCYVELKDFGGDPVKIPVPKSGSWIKKEARDLKITTGKCTILIYSDAKAGYWINLDDFLLYDQKNSPVTEAVKEGAQSNLMVNGSLEEGDGKNLNEWQVVSDKDQDAAYRETGWAQAGEAKLTNWKGQDYKVYTYQMIQGLANDTYTLEFWYANGGKQNNCYVEIKDFGGEAIRETLPINPKWGKVRIPNITVTNGNCTIGINTDAKANYWINLDDFKFFPDPKYAEPDPVKFTAKEYPMPIKGVDLSTLPQVEAGGGKFYNLAGEQEDVLKILKDNGVNYVRLRIWNNPQNGICGRENTLAMASRIKKAGMGLLLDFHYSDKWADPGTQEKPAAWKDLNFEGLKKAVYEYTKGIISDLKKQKTLPDMVQIGNEIRGGMLFPDGRLTDVNSFKNLAQLISSGAKGVKDALGNGDKVKIVIHLDQGGNNEAYTYFFDNLIKNGVKFDVIALSYYIEWHGKPSALYDNLCKLARKYKKELIVAETAYPFTLNEGDGLENIMAKDDQLRGTGYPPTIRGQKRFLEDLISIIKHTPNGKGLGFFYWEGAWLPVKGAGWDPNDPESKDAWENQCLFNFNGYALDSL
jgi:arabinogalactan endo-1,4-beta-galactosidase